MRRLLIALVLLTVLSIPAHVLGQATFKIEIFNDTEGKLTYQIHEVKEASGKYFTSIVASGKLEPQTRIVEPQDFLIGQYIIVMVLMDKGRLQVLKNHFIVNSNTAKILINSHEVRSLNINI